MIKMLNLTNTRSDAYVSGIPSFAKTLEGAHSVNTLSVSTQVGHDLTFINICTENTNIKYVIFQF